MVTAPADGSSTPFPTREPSTSPTEIHPALAATSSGDNCPTCGKPLAADQRYCLECGHRRGDPRLPFMDAVVFMEAINKPQTPAATAAPGGGSGKPRGLSANSALIAGIATLVLAIGVGVLIGQGGDGGTSSAANQAPQIIRVGGEGGGEAEDSSAEEGSNKASGKSKGNEKKADNATAKKAEAKTETGSTGQTKATEEVLEPKVPQAKPEAQLGETCDKGTAGCSDNGKFEGNFFGE
jgi:hypothetical protein